MATRTLLALVAVLAIAAAPAALAKGEKDDIVGLWAKVEWPHSFVGSSWPPVTNDTFAYAVVTATGFSDQIFNIQWITFAPTVSISQGDRSRGPRAWAPSVGTHMYAHGMVVRTAKRTYDLIVSLPLTSGVGRLTSDGKRLSLYGLGTTKFASSNEGFAGMYKVPTGEFKIPKTA